jgi:hypothetical protein
MRAILVMIDYCGLCSLSKNHIFRGTSVVVNVDGKASGYERCFHLDREVPELAVGCANNVDTILDGEFSDMEQALLEGCKGLSPNGPAMTLVSTRAYNEITQELANLREQLNTLTSQC